MGTPEVPHNVESRLTHVEDAVQEIRFVHMTKTDAQSNGMGILYAGQQRLEHMLAGFRMEVAAELGSFRADVDAKFGAVNTRLETIESTLAEVLRRLPEPDKPA